MSFNHVQRSDQEPYAIYKEGQEAGCFKLVITSCSWFLYCLEEIVYIDGSRERCIRQPLLSVHIDILFLKQVKNINYTICSNTLNH